MKSLKLLVLIFLCLNLKLIAQERLSDKKLEFSYEDTTLEAIIKDLSNRYDLRFSFVNNQIPLKQTFSVKGEDMPLEEALTSIFLSTDVDFKIVNGQVVLRQNSDKKPIKTESLAKVAHPPGSGFKKAENGRKEFVENEVVEGSSEVISEGFTEPEPIEETSRQDGVAPLRENKVGKFFKSIFLKKEKEKIEGDLQEKADENNIKPVHIGLIYPLSTNFTDAPHYVNRLSFHALSGVSKGLEGVEFSGVGNVTVEDVKGAQFAGFFNIAGGDVEGVQAAGFINLSKGFVHGAQLAGFINIGRDSAFSTSLAGFGNFRSGNIKGGQFAGFINQAENVHGVQSAGFLNKSKDINGAQISGFINAAKTVKGVQVGIFNFADSVDGVSIGVFNFIKHGYRRLELFGIESLHANVAFKFGTQRFYSILAAGSRFQDDFIWGYGFGLGSQFDLINSWKMSLDVTGYHIIEKYNRDHLITRNKSSYRVNWDDLNMNSNIRLGFDRVFHRYFAISFGPTFNVFVTERTGLFDETQSRFAPYHVFNKTFSGTNVKMWPGFFVGIRI